MLSSYLLNAGTELWGKKWRKSIMWLLKDHPMRFSELKRKLPECSVKMLSEALDAMEADGLIIRIQYSDSIPIKVTYQLTDDMQVMVDNMQKYVALLARFFYKNREKHNVPAHIIELLEREQVPMK